MSEMLEKARKYEKVESAKIAKESRPAFHFSNPVGWMNDPNGFSDYKGEHHLFFQYYPYATHWDSMHWGHAKSTDFIKWEYLPTALAPDQDYDNSGVFSGSAIEDGEKQILIYTGVEEKAAPNGEKCIRQNQCVAIGNGVEYEKIENNPVVTANMLPEGSSLEDFRDPKVWKENGKYYMVAGSRHSDGSGQIALFCAEKLEKWEFAGILDRSEHKIGRMWECPDYFEVDNRQVVIFSPMQLFKDGKAEDAQTVCMQVKFDEKTCQMELPDEYQFMDYGMDLYAPQSTLDEEGRRILTAWLRMPEPVDGKWQGMMCIPRVVEAKENHIYFRVHPNIQAAYTREISAPYEADESGYRVRFSLKDGEKVNIGGYIIYREGSRICTDRSSLYRKFTNHRVQFITPELKEGFELEVYVNPNLIEVFVNDGEAVISNTVYDLGKEIETDVKMRIETLEK